MQHLTNEQIGKLAARKGVKTVAVENFLGTLDETLTKNMQSHNAYTDACAYRWKAATLKAIQDGINLAYSE